MFCGNVLKAKLLIALFADKNSKKLVYVFLFPGMQFLTFQKETDFGSSDSNVKFLCFRTNSCRCLRLCFSKKQTTRCDLN